MLFIPALSQKYKSFDAINKGNSDGMWSTVIKSFVENFLEFFEAGKSYALFIVVISLAIAIISYGYGSNHMMIEMSKNRFCRCMIAILAIGGMAAGLIRIFSVALLKAIV